jgi:hypothetical protein
LQNLFQIWKRPVHLETYDDDRPIVMSFDGEEHSHEERTED